MKWIFGSWNVAKMSKRSSEVGNDLSRKKVDVCGAQETIRGLLLQKVKDICSGGDGNGSVGTVGVVDKEELVEQVYDLRRSSDTVIVIVIVIGK